MEARNGLLASLVAWAETAALLAAGCTGGCTVYITLTTLPVGSTRGLGSLLERTLVLAVLLIIPTCAAVWLVLFRVDRSPTGLRSLQVCVASVFIVAAGCAIGVVAQAQDDVLRTGIKQGSARGLNLPHLVTPERMVDGGEGAVRRRHENESSTPWSHGSLIASPTLALTECVRIPGPLGQRDHARPFDAWVRAEAAKA